MLWKVYNIQNGKTLRAGFESEEEAKEWLELKGDDLQDHYEVEEMDFDEEEEWREAQEAGEDAIDEELEDLDEEEALPLTFGEEYYDGDDLPDDDDLSVIDDDDIN